MDLYFLSSATNRMDPTPPSKRRQRASSTQSTPPIKYYSIDVNVDVGTSWKFVGRSGPGPEKGVTMYRFGFPEYSNMNESCMAFLVHHNSTEISLQWVSHSPKCIESGELPESRGSQVMVRATCCFMMRMRPECNTITLMDDSKLKRCVKGLNARTGAQQQTNTLGMPLVRVSLAHHSIMLYGETWYQRKMNAVIVHPRTGPDELASVRKKLAMRPPPGDFDEVFWKKYMPDETNLYFEWLDDVKPTMARLYEEASTDTQSDWMTYFRSVNDACGCGVFSVLEGKFARDMLGLEMSTWVWSISRETIEAYDRDNTSWIGRLTITDGIAAPVQRGGRKPGGGSKTTGGGSKTTGGASATRMTRASDDLFEAVDHLRAWEDSTVGMRQVFFR